MKTLGWIALCVLVAMGVRHLFPREVTVPIPAPPAKPDTTIVTLTDTAAIRELKAENHALHARIEDLEAEAPEPAVVTLWREAAPDTVRVCTASEILEGSWYIEALAAGASYGDTAQVQAVRIGADSAGVRLRRETARVFQSGPLIGVRANAAGWRLIFAPREDPPATCDVWDRLQWAAGGAAAITLAREAI